MTGSVGVVGGGIMGSGIAEVAARESLAGTGPMVFAQPGTPRSVVGWKAAATLALPASAQGATLNLTGPVLGDMSAAATTPRNLTYRS